jgi:hypothetical protein
MEVRYGIEGRLGAQGVTRDGTSLPNNALASTREIVNTVSTSTVCPGTQSELRPTRNNFAGPSDMPATSRPTTSEVRLK